MTQSLEAGLFVGSLHQPMGPLPGKCAPSYCGCGFVTKGGALLLCRYYSQCFLQHTGQELADNLKVAMAKALQKYHQVNQALPDRIIVYRDGVGDGQVCVCV